MEQQQSNTSLNIELEDLLLGNENGINKEKLTQNMPIYTSMVQNIYSWIQSYKQTHTESLHTIKKDFSKYLQQLMKQHRIYCKKNILVYAYREMLYKKEIQDDYLMWQLLQKCAQRTQSGVTVITVLFSPYPNGQTFTCEHNCYYCPNEPDQPRSYLKQEPAVARANRNKFDPILQMQDRIQSLMVNGHTIDKVEIIIEGGTITSYPKSYLEDFHRDLIYCANTYFDETPKREKLSVREEIKINATSKIRIIGICIETRPDTLIDKDGNSWLPLFRRWGITRIQIGVQHSDNTILKKINRGHTFEDACLAMKYLKDNCFKVDIHIMPDLPYTTPELDKKMIDTVFKSSELQPDQIKIYPCEVVPWTVIQQWHQNGKYKPYAQTNERALLDNVKYAMEICPPWIRLPRVIRDIPLTYIEGGNMYPNLRQMLMDELSREGKTTMDIRARECSRHPQYNIQDAVYVVRSYEANCGKEYFISLESRDEVALFGFIRLRIPEYKVSEHHQEFEVLHNKGLIRELHVYGNVLNVGNHNNDNSYAQHKGVGKELVSMAENIAVKEECSGIVIISGIGVTKYYEKLGYTEKDTYMVKEFSLWRIVPSWAKYICYVLMGIALFSIVLLFIDLYDIM